MSSLYRIDIAKRGSSGWRVVLSDGQETLWSGFVSAGHRDLAFTMTVLADMILAIEQDAETTNA